MGATAPPFLLPHWVEVQEVARLPLNLLVRMGLQEAVRATEIHTEAHCRFLEVLLQAMGLMVGMYQQVLPTTLGLVVVEQAQLVKTPIKTRGVITLGLVVQVSRQI